jgi:N-terminal domain of anti-restriction factor ArdC
MRSIRRLSDAEPEQRREQDRQRLHKAANRLLTSEGWQRWVRVRARGGLVRLSLNNQLLTALSCPDATLVAGFKAWLSLGYCVRKGETAIRIIAPMPVKPRRDVDIDDDTAGDARPRVLFKAVRCSIAPQRLVRASRVDAANSESVAEAQPLSLLVSGQRQSPELPTPHAGASSHAGFDPRVAQASVTRARGIGSATWSTLPVGQHSGHEPLAGREAATSGPAHDGHSQTCLCGRTRIWPPTSRVLLSADLETGVAV